jgi:anaerobic ribonucleoside-triphosphate reductase activating protein
MGEGLTVRVGARVPSTEAEGPGRRYALWVQGCSLRCRGCCNPHLFAPAGGTAVPVALLLDEVRRAQADSRSAIEGVTLLGGEPFEQAGALAPFAEGVRALGLSVVAFTGYRLEELRAPPLAGPPVARLLGAVDVLVDGRYEASRPEASRPWVGSRNQRFHYLTARYSRAIERAGPDGPVQTVEVRLTPDGRLSANGWPVRLGTKAVR